MGFAYGTSTYPSSVGIGTGVLSEPAVSRAVAIAAALCVVAHSAQLLVLGRLPHAGAIRPVPADLIQHSFCPVAVVPDVIR
jgi:hypothetical protein